MTVFNNNIIWIIISILLGIICMVCFIFYFIIVIKFLENNYNLQIEYNIVLFFNSRSICCPIFNIDPVTNNIDPVTNNIDPVTNNIDPVTNNIDPVEDEHTEIEIISEEDYHKKTGNIIIVGPNDNITIGTFK